MVELEIGVPEGERFEGYLYVCIDVEVSTAAVVETAEVVVEVEVAGGFDVVEEIGEVLGVVGVVGTEGDAADVQGSEAQS